jgi:16S rRNA (cytidine1402-2'-O)-methyltransferase
MTQGRLLLLPSPIGAGPIDEVLPKGVVTAAHATHHFLAERAKTARAFLKAIGHPVAMQALDITEIGHAPDAARIPDWLRPVRDGHDVALVSEAGCPGVADPGASIVRFAHEHGIAVHPLVGPSALLLALMASGLNGQAFRFVGYLPQDAAQLATAIVALESTSCSGETQLFIETPYRNERLFDTLLRECAGDTRLTIAAALTQTDEFVVTRAIEVWRGLSGADRPALRDRPTVFALMGARRAGIRKPR